MMETLCSSSSQKANSRPSNSSSNREEGEISEDDNDEDGNNSPLKWDSYKQSSGPYRKERNTSNPSKNRSSDEIQREEWHRKNEFETLHGLDSHYNRNQGVSQRSRHHGRKKRSHSNWDRKRSSHSTNEIETSDYLENQPPVSHSKIWENHHLRRASSVRPRSPLLAARPRSPNLHEGEDEFLKLMREHKRIQEQLKSLESEEKKSIYDDQNDEDRNKFLEEERLLEDIGKLPQSTPESELHSDVLESNAVEMEDISEEEDFDEQELRRMALATSARHNQLIASEVLKVPVSPSKPVTTAPKDDVQVVVIPDVEPDAPAPVVVVVEEDESTGGKQSKEGGKKGGHKKKDGSKSRKTHGKKKKRDLSKDGSKKVFPVTKNKGNLSKKDWQRREKVIQVLNLKGNESPEKILEKLFKRTSSPSVPKLTGTMGDFKRQHRLPLLNRSQSSQSTKDKKATISDGNEGEASKRKPSGNLQDNYEEVEMDIESDKEENTTSNLKLNSTMETLQLGSDFNQAMQPLSAMMYANAVPMYPANHFVPHPSMTPMTYQGQGLSSIPMPPQPPLPPPPCPPPLPHSQPPLPPPHPKSPPPPPPPLLPLPTPSDQNLNNNAYSMTNMSNNTTLNQPSPSQPNVFMPNSYVQYASQFGFMEGDFQTKYNSYPSVDSSLNLAMSSSGNKGGLDSSGNKVVDSSGSRASLACKSRALDSSGGRATLEKAPSISVNAIGKQLHQLRKEQTKKVESKPSDGNDQSVVDIKIIYDKVNHLRKLLSEESERNTSRSETESRKAMDSYHSRYSGGDDRQSYRHSHGVSEDSGSSQKNISFRLSSKKEGDLLKFSDVRSEDSSSTMLRRNLDGSHKSSGVLDKVKDGQGRKQDGKETYSPHFESKSYSHSVRPPQSPHVTSRKSPKRRLEMSPRDALLQKERWKDLASRDSLEYEPESPYSKHPKRVSPPPYIPSSKASALGTNDTKRKDTADEITKGNKDDTRKDDTDSEDDIDPDFLRRQLLTDMIKKRTSAQLEANSMDSGHSSPGTADKANLQVRVMSPEHCTDTELPEGGDQVKLSDKRPTDNPDITGRSSTEHSKVTIKKGDSDDDSDEDLIPPPVVSRVWNRSSSLPVQAPSSSRDSIQMLNGLKNAHHRSIPSPHHTENLQSPSSLSCDPTDATVVQSSFQHEEESPAAQSKLTSHAQALQNSVVEKKSNDNETGLPIISSHINDGLVQPISKNVPTHIVAKIKSSQNFQPYGPVVTPSSSSSATSSHTSVKGASTSTPTNSSVNTTKPTTTHHARLPGVTAVVQSTMSTKQRNTPTHSVMQRTIETSIQNNGLRNSSRNSSPLSDREGFTASNRIQKKHSAMIVPPVHPSVIVPLQTSSDDEEDEEKEDSEMTPADSYQSKMTRLWEEDQRLCQQKKAILTDQEKLKGLLTKVSELITAHKRSETRSQTLVAQIASLIEEKQVAEKMAKAQAELKERTKQVAKNVKDRLIKKKSDFLEKTKSVVALGQVLIGAEFIPTALQTSQENATKTQTAVPPPDPQTKKAQKIAAEKHKLKEKEKKIAEKLKLLKETNLRKANARTLKGIVLGRKYRNLQAKKPGSDPPSDVIRLGKDSNQDMVVRKQRRKSLLSNDSSTTPNLPKTSKRSVSESTSDLAVDDVTETHHKESNKFKMPRDSQLANLCKLQEEKMAKIFSNSSTDSCVSVMDPFLVLISLSEGEIGNADVRRTARSSHGEFKSSSLAYTSPLRCFRAYRFSPFYRTKENLSLVSLSHSHKVNPRCVMCPYDLQGTCNDDNCQQQHPKDYTLTDKETLEDFVSYHPQIAGIKDDASPQDIQKGIATYVDSFIAKHKGRMALEELCLVLNLEVSKVTGKSHSLGIKQRQWRPPPKKEAGLSIHLDHKSSSRSLNSLDMTRNHQHYDRDALVGEDDMRYFNGEGSDVLSLEADVMENQQNTALWLQLSARKLADPNRPVKESLEHALNILARGLEVNRASCDLWLQYLRLYQRHTQGSDMTQFCQMALDYAPSYDLWIFYLSTLKTYQDKEDVCKKTLDYLCESVTCVDDSLPQSQDGEEKKEIKDPLTTEDSGQSEDNVQQSVKCPKLSHQVFEMIVYRVSLNILTGRFNTSLKFLQFILGVKKRDGSDVAQASRLVSLLTNSDHLVLWLVYIHVVEWQQLPAGLMEASSDLPGRIVCKDITLPWSLRPALNTSVESLVNVHLLARKLWTHGQDKGVMEGHYVQLIKSLIQLLVSQQLHSKALAICRKVLLEPHLVDIWVLCAHLHDKVGDKEAALQTLERGLEANPLNPKLHFYQAVHICNKGDKEKVLHSLEQFILAHFQDSDSQQVQDPNLLFCQLLKQDEAFSVLQPRMKESIPPNLHKNVFMWMSYCQLLELQGETQETIEVFERSLSHVESNVDLVLVWQTYISYLVRCGLLSQSWPDILTRSIISSSTKQSLPFSNGASVVDYRHSNQIIDAWLCVLPPSQKLDAVEKCLDFMPGNVALLLRGLDLCVAMKETRRAYCWCRMVLAQHDRPSNLCFWKTAAALAHREGTQTETEQFLVGGVECLPLAVSAWKDLLLFEVCREDTDMVDKILAHCGQLGVNITGFVDTIASQS